MNITEVIVAVSAMHADGLIESYAIGGAVGATFHLEPVATLDVDIFVVFRRDPSSSLIDMTPIFEYLVHRGFQRQGEYVMIGGWPVQFLPVTGPLVEEALEQALTIQVGKTPARVFTAEHLAAIALQVGRAKDKARLVQFAEAEVLNHDRFQAILARHQLVEAWEKFATLFLTEPS